MNVPVRSVLLALTVSGALLGCAATGAQSMVIATSRAHGVAGSRDALSSEGGGRIAMTARDEPAREPGERGPIEHGVPTPQPAREPMMLSTPVPQPALPSSPYSYGNDRARFQ